MDGKVIAHAKQNTEVNRSKYSMPLTQFADGVINLNFDQQGDMVMSQGDIDEQIVGLIMANQYSLNKRVELFGDCGKGAVIKKLRQTHDMET